MSARQTVCAGECPLETTCNIYMSQALKRAATRWNFSVYDLQRPSFPKLNEQGICVGKVAYFLGTNLRLQKSLWTVTASVNRITHGRLLLGLKIGCETDAPALGHRWLHEVSNGGKNSRDRVIVGGELFI